MRIGIGHNEYEAIFARHIAQSTLQIVALAVEQGIELTPEILRGAEIHLVKEQGQDTMKITFHERREDRGDDWRKFDFTGGRKL